MKTIFLVLISLMLLGSGLAYAGQYIDSAHGTQDGAITGVDRLSAYTDGNCAHCHEQHASVDGSEPSPTGGPDNYLLFDTSHSSQTADFCFDCHVDAASQQSGGTLNNYSYSYRAGNYDDSASNDDIKQAFGLASSHSLDNIVTFITGKWGYTANSNPCCGCHNPHAVQGDPAASSNAKSAGSRGYPVSRPSLHTTLTSWGLWGDASGEKMSDYSNYYQAPYRPGDTNYEPDGSSTTTGLNLTDFVTFCQDCHSYDMTAAPYSLPNTPVDWTTTGGEAGGDKHGKNVATVGVDLDEPYATAWDSSNGLVLACTDCHEAHGSTNVFLIRTEANGEAVGSGTVTTTSSSDCTPQYTDNAVDWKNLCSRCHNDDYEYIHHLSPDKPYNAIGCSACHPPGQSPINCSCCHYHGSSASGRVTF